MSTIFFCSLPFATLRAANIKRLPMFKNRHGNLCHNFDGSDWSLAQWLQALAGEAGEYANVRKKFDRADLNSEEFLQEAADELADIFVYADLFAFRCGIELGSIMPHGTFALNGEMVKRNLRAIERTPETIAESFLAMHETISRLAKKTLEYRGDELHHKVKVAPKLLDFLMQLFVLAQVLDIDLGEAVQRKFNKTSDKVKADIYMVERETDLGKQWAIDSTPF